MQSACCPGCEGLAGLARGIRRHLHHQPARHGQAAAYPGVRTPANLIKTVAWAVVGVFRISSRILRWWHVTDLYQLEHQAAADGLLTEHLRIHKQGRESRTARWIILVVCAVLAAVAALFAVKHAPSWALILAAVASVPVLARHGTRQVSRSCSQRCSGPRCRRLARM